MTTTKNIAKLGIAVALVAMAPLAFAQTSSSTTGGSGTYTSPSTQGSTGATTNTSGATTTGGSANSTTGTTSSTTPGTPNTGAGGTAATNAIVLTVSALVALGGLAYLARTRKVA